LKVFDLFCFDKKYTRDTYMYVYVIKKVLFKKYWYRYWQYFFHEVLVLISAILFEASTDIGIANTFKKYC